MAIRIRRATAADAEFLAWVMPSASRANLSRGVWDLLIGAGERGCLDYLRRLALAEPRSLCHHESFWLADVDGVPAAALCRFEFRAGGWFTVAEAGFKPSDEKRCSEMAAVLNAAGFVRFLGKF